jgi:excisionase family DNA binding protein
MAEIRQVMDIGAASEYLGVSMGTLYSFVNEEKVPAFKLGNRWKFKKTILDRWMERQTAQFEQRGIRRLRATARQGSSLPRSKTRMSEASPSSRDPSPVNPPRLVEVSVDVLCCQQPFEYPWS